MRFNHVELTVSAPTSWRNKATRITLHLKELGLLKEDASEDPNIDPAEYEPQQFVDWAESLLNTLFDKNRMPGPEVTGLWTRTTPDKSGWYLCKIGDDEQPEPMRYIQRNNGNNFWVDVTGKTYTNVIYLNTL